MPRPVRTKVAPLALGHKNKANARPGSGKQAKRLSHVAAAGAKSSSDSAVLGPQDNGASNPDLMMTGAMGNGDSPAVPRRSSRRSANAAVESPSSPAPAQRIMSEDASGASSHEIESSLDATEDGNTPQAQRSLQSQSGLNSRRTSVQRPASSRALFGTPGMTSSVQALAGFKRRKRQGSIVGRMRRASAMSATLGGNADAESQLDHFASDLDDFNPDDESTPLHGTIMKDALHSSTSRKRRHDGSPIDHSGSVVQLSSPLASSVRHSSADLPDAAAAHTAVNPDSTEGQNRSDAPEADEDGELTSTMAPPLSSSVLGPSSPTSSTDGRRGKSHRSIHLSTLELTSLLPKTRRRTPLRASMRSMYNLPSSTTDITSDGIDLSSPAASEDEEEDETFIAAPRSTRATRAHAKSSPLKSKSKRSTGVRKQPEATKAAAKGAAKQSHAPKSKRKSYRAAIEVDKENEEDDSYAAEPDTLDEDTIIETAKSMKKMKDKFAEIDQFEMSYETVDIGSENSLWR